MTVVNFNSTTCLVVYYYLYIKEFMETEIQQVSGQNKSYCTYLKYVLL
jgi:hypothetical protein